MSMCEEEPIKPWTQKVVLKEVFTLHKPILWEIQWNLPFSSMYDEHPLLFIDEPYPTSTDLQHVKHI